MKSIALVKNDVLEQIVVGDLETIQDLFTSYVCVELEENSLHPSLGARFNGEKFEPDKLHESWTWDEELFDYVPPVPMPEDGLSYHWGEESQDWILTEEE